MTSLLPLVTFDRIDDDLADRSLELWGHWLGGCNRPFGRQSFGLFVDEQLVSVAVSASTVNAVCGGWARDRVVELARQCSAPGQQQFSRVVVRLWRELAPRAWNYWPVEAVVSYSDKARHTGDLYRFDGWTKVAETRGGVTGPNGGWNPSKRIAPKAVWVYVVGKMTAEQRRARALEVAA